MSTSLRDEVTRLDGRPYGDYRRLGRRAWAVEAFHVTIEHVQGDPFAAPSRVRIDVPPDVLSLPSYAFATRDARRATADFLHRAVDREFRCSRHLRVESRGRVGDRRRGGRSGSGGSGQIEIVRAGQEVLDRTAVVVGTDGGVRVRLTVGLPATGRRILGRSAAELLARVLPCSLEAALEKDNVDGSALAEHVHRVEDQVALRATLESNGLVAFLAEGAILPRASGVDDRPLRDALPLVVPDELAVELVAPRRGRIRGLGVRSGITLIAGGGYHGKSTLLEALARSVYDHVPGDGRDLCVTRHDAVCIRAEDGRAVRGVDLRPFIQNLPLGRPTERFDTDDASGSTSQAAAIVEALEAGTGALLIDEDTAATNFMIRDERMRRLIAPEREPITPFLDRVRELKDDQNVSSVLVVGGAGDYLDVADCVIGMDTYQPSDMTLAAKRVAAELPQAAEAVSVTLERWQIPGPRCPRPESFDASRGRRMERVRSRSTRSIEFGREEVDVSSVAQLIDPAQCRLIGDVLLSLSRGLCDGRMSLSEILDELERRATREGIEALAEPSFGDRAYVRRQEVAAAINRLRSLRIAR